MLCLGGLNPAQAADEGKVFSCFLLCLKETPIEWKPHGHDCPRSKLLSLHGIYLGRAAT